MLRSILFVPADRPDRFAKAMTSGADAIAIDLEDSVASDRKAAGRDAVAAFLAGPRGEAQVFVRINPLGSGLEADDIAAILAHPPDAILLPKAEGAESILALTGLLQDHSIPILPIATETPSAVFHLGSYGAVADRLIGLTWGAEDLPAAMGAATSREANGRFTPPYEVVRSLALIGAHAAGVPAIETVYPNIADTDGLAGYVARGRRDGFTGMMAIHPAQVPIINVGFSPSAQEIVGAKAIVAAFAAAPGAGAIQLDGKMLDQPHLASARRILNQAGLPVAE
jgi:citrate lyase subunit beta / citryl-CoA lyase